MVRALKEDGREQDGRKRRGERGQGSNYKVLNSCFACPMSFPASLMGEDSRKKTGKSRQKGGVSSNNLRLYSVARDPFASVNKGCRGGWGEGEGLLGLVMKTRDKENGSTESCLDPHITISCNTSPNNMHSMQEVAAYQGGRF